MDNSSDDTITFDENGYCNYCTGALTQIGQIYFPNEEGKRRLDALLTEVKEYGKGGKYDCIMGLSGGIDSSYLAYLGYKWGLRILAVHIDDGFDTDISKANLENLIAATHFDYEVIKPDAEQFNDLTLAFMKAGVSNLDMPQDNVLFAFLYKKMKEHKIRYFLSGGNFALESILQKGNMHDAYDVVNIKDIHKKYGRLPIDKLELLSTFERKKDEYILGVKSPRPLNYIDYNRDRAFKELHEFCGFEYYGRKHLENILTAFIQCYWFPKKFGVDKRTSHLSSMIVSGQMTREEALRELEEPLYDEKKMQDYIQLIKEKLNISDVEFDEIMNAPTHEHTDYKTEDKRIYLMLSFLKKLYKSTVNWVS
jgi:N-acetyl sugar amidotransferase